MKLAIVVGALLLLGAITRTGLDFYTSAIYLAKSDGYAAGKAAGVVSGKAAGIAEASALYAPKAPDATVQAFAQDICDGTPKPEVLAPNGYVTPDQFTSYAAKYVARGYTCVNIRYLASVPHPDGSTDELYAMTVGPDPLWYIFTFSGGLVTNIH